MKRKIQLIFTLLSIFYTNYASSQTANADNFVSINITSSSFVGITSPTQLTSQQTKTSAFILTMESRNYTGKISVQASTTSPIPLSKLGLKLNSVGGSSPTSVIGESFTTVFMTGSQQQLFTLAKTNKANATMTATYDLVLDPIGWFIPSGSYSFSLYFLMTQP